VKVLGVDPFGSGPQSRALLNEMMKVGFRKSELEYATEIPEEGADWYMLFGSPALKEFVGPDVRMADVRGQLLRCDWNPEALIVANYAPGYIYHNPNLKPLWIEGLEHAFLYYSLDVKGLVA
jgi:hypothetical protein